MKDTEKVERRYMLRETERLLDQIDEIVSRYHPTLREDARDILIGKVFGGIEDLRAIAQRVRRAMSARVAPQEPALEKSLLPPGRTTQADQVLIATYRLQKELRTRLLTGNQINSKLKENGITISNISVAANENIKLNPARMKKVMTPGHRNGYSITKAGVRYLREKLRDF
jgi:hypothetical protein